MRGIIPRPLGQMREYAGHLSRQSILDFSLSSCACSLWHSPPLHSDPSWLNQLFYFINIHYVTRSCMATETRNRKSYTSHVGVFPSAPFFPWIQLLGERWYTGTLKLQEADRCVVVFPKNSPHPDWQVRFPVTCWTWTQVDEPCFI